MQPCNPHLGGKGGHLTGIGLLYLPLDNAQSARKSVAIHFGLVKVAPPALGPCNTNAYTHAVPGPCPCPSFDGQNKLKAGTSLQSSAPQFKVLRARCHCHCHCQSVSLVAKKQNQTKPAQTKNSARIRAVLQSPASSPTAMKTKTTTMRSLISLEKAATFCCRPTVLPTLRGHQRRSVEQKAFGGDQIGFTLLTSTDIDL